MTDIVKADKTVSERFIGKVIDECKAASNGRFEITDEQRRLVQEYFYGIEEVLKASEIKRQAQVAAGSKYAPAVAYTWNNVNLNRLALDSVYYSRLGLSMQSRNHLYPIPFFNKATGLYDVNFMMGYRGMGYLAKKFALQPFKHCVCELVYKNDDFKVVKKAGFDGDGDRYEFSIPTPFDRGEVVGGFGYVQYEDSSMNRLYTISIAELLKRKPKNASPEFWGGEKDKWDKGKRVGTEKVDGWYEQMLYKTLYRFVYGQIELDPSKVTEEMTYIRKREEEIEKLQVQQEIEENAGKIVIDGETGDAPNGDPVDF